MTDQFQATQTDSSSRAEKTPGVRRTVAFALAALGMEIVQRSTLRALLAKGERKPRGTCNGQRRRHDRRISGTKNKTSAAFGQALNEFERRGWIYRTPELVIVRDRGALLRLALRGRPAAPRELLNLQGALDAIRAEATPSHVPVEQRRRELRAITALMRAPAGGDVCGGPGSVRIVHKPQLI